MAVVDRVPDREVEHDGSGQQPRVWLQYSYRHFEDHPNAIARKIIGTGDRLRISATCARVPVITGHSVSANVETRDPLSPERCRELLAASPGIVVMDDPAQGIYPLPTAVAGRDDVLVGRIRRDPSQDNTLNMWIVGDNLRAMNFLTPEQQRRRSSAGAPKSCAPSRWPTKGSVCRA